MRMISLSLYKDNIISILFFYEQIVCNKYINYLCILIFFANSKILSNMNNEQKKLSIINENRKRKT